MTYAAERLLIPCQYPKLHNRFLANIRTTRCYRSMSLRRRQGVHDPRVHGALGLVPAGRIGIEAGLFQVELQAEQFADAGG